MQFDANEFIGFGTYTASVFRAQLAVNSNTCPLLRSRCPTCPLPEMMCSCFSQDKASYRSCAVFGESTSSSSPHKIKVGPWIPASLFKVLTKNASAPPGNGNAAIAARTERETKTQR